MSIDRCPVAHGTDFTDPDLIQARVPLPEFAWLRENRPLFWNPQTQENSSFTDGGFWLATRHEDVKEISCAREGWSSEENTAIVKFEGQTVDKDARDIQKNMMLNMDDPHHAKVRGIVSRGVFTPRGVSKIEDALRARANQICIEAKAKGQGNFVEDVACELPLQALADLMGFPQDDRKQIFDWSNQMMAYDDPDFEVDPAVAAAEILGYAMTIGETRKACPADDIITKLVAASTEADTLTTDEFAWFILMLAVAGNETTRNAISHGMHAFLNNPDQKQRWLDDLDGVSASAVEEVIRWATPVVHFRRTCAAQDAVVGDQHVKEGDKVVLWYSAANRDPSVFADPYAFDVLRDPNDHVGFGGGGPHFCLGAHLARREIRVMFDELLRRLPDIEVTGEPEYLQSNFIHGIKRMPVSFSPV